MNDTIEHFGGPLDGARCVLADDVLIGEIVIQPVFIHTSIEVAPEVRCAHYEFDGDRLNYVRSSPATVKWED